MGAFSKFQALTFATLLSKPFIKWDAYKLGIIDENGKKIKKATTSDEKNSIDMFQNLIRKLKIVLNKFIPSPNYLQFILAAYLLKEEKFTKNEEELKIEIDKVLNDKEKDILFETIKDKIFLNI